MKILLREVRESRKIGLRELSRKSKISAKQLIAIESNQSDPKLSTICAIAKALSVDPSMLFVCDENWWEGV